VLLLGLLSACTVGPTGPTVMVLPGVGKPFDQLSWAAGLEEAAGPWARRDV
jgi:hypothetical protein